MTATIAYPTFAVPWPGALHSAKNASARGHPQNQGEEVAQSPEQPPQWTLTLRVPVHPERPDRSNVNARISAT
jgi:hypothetical protein